MAASNLKKIVARVSWIIGARSGAAFDDNLDDDRFIKEEAQRAVLETEAEIVKTICETGNPHRVAFQVVSSSLTHGATLPARLGPLEKVEIQSYDGDGWSLGEETNRENIQLWRENYNNIFDPVAHNQSGSNLADFYTIENDTIWFTGHRARVTYCSYASDYATPALVIDDNFDPALVCGGVSKLTKHGTPTGISGYYSQAYQQQIMMIAGGAMAMPQIDDLQEMK